MNTLFILLQAEGEAGETGGFNSMWIMMGLLFVVMYFFMIRPQQKKAKAAAKFREELAKGDKVITIGGIHGKILDINDRTIMIQCETGKLLLEKSAVSADNSANELEVNQKK
jgi:preprotein translocase subunit YajC